MKYSSFFYCICILIFCNSCSKKTDPADTEPPVVTFSTPNDYEVFIGAQSINVSGTVTDNHYVDQIHIVVTDMAGNNEYFHVHIHPDVRAFTYNQSIAIEPGKIYKISVIGDDAAYNSSAPITKVIYCN